MPVTRLAARVLLVSRDLKIVHLLCRLMEQAGMDIEICSDMSVAPAKLCKSKFDAIAVDFKDVELAIELLNKIHSMTSHRRAVVVAILGMDGDVQSAFRAGANFALERTLYSSIVTRTLRAAYPLMIRERRRYYRCPLQIPVYLTVDTRHEFQVTAINISEGGMAIEAPSSFHVGKRLELELILPGTHHPLKAVAEVCWNNNAGRVGLKFAHVTSHSLEQLQTWLSERLQEAFSSVPSLIEI